jgi:shikimate dehydrogenase
MLRYVGSVDATARAIGAVNTVVRRRGQLWGTNTDAPGALDAIEQVALVRGKRVLVLGAGGAARAIAFEARQRGAHVIVANRTASKAKRLAAEFGIGFVPFGEFAGTPFDVFVNATSVGMWPHVHRTPVPARALAGKIVLDVVYHPPLTRLLRDAVEAGARIVPGTDMYVNQGARQFRLYAGIPADVRMMKKLLREHQ